MKKITALAFIASLLLAASTVALADNVTPTPEASPAPTPHFQRPAPVKYTADQQACIIAERKTQQTAVKAANDTFDAATQNALTTKNTALKAATDTFNAATGNALQTKEDAIKAANGISNIKTRLAALGAADEAFNNSEEVKQARPAYVAAIQAANDAYNNDPTVVAAKGPETDAIKAARTTNIIKDCTGTQSVWQKIGKYVNDTTSALINALPFSFPFMK